MVWASQALLIRQKKYSVHSWEVSRSSYPESSPKEMFNNLASHPKKNDVCLIVSVLMIWWQSWESHQLEEKWENKGASGHRESSTYLWGNAHSQASCPPAAWHCRRSWWSAPRGICHRLPESSPLWWRCPLCRYWRQLRSSPVPIIKRHKRQVTTHCKIFSLSSWSWN